MPQQQNPTGFPLRFIQAGGVRTVYGSPNGVAVPQAAGAQIVTDPAAAAAPAVDTIAVALAGQGSLSTTVTEYQLFTVGLAGTSSLSAAVDEPHAFVVALAGTSTLAATVAELKRFTVALAGVGTLAASVTEPHPLAVTLAGASSLAAATTEPHPFAVAVAGSSTLAATPTTYQRFTAGLAGQGSLDSRLNTGTSFAPLVVTLAGASALTTTPVTIPVTPPPQPFVDSGRAAWFNAPRERSPLTRILTLPPVVFAGTSRLAVALSVLPTQFSTSTPAGDEPTRLHHAPAEAVEAEIVRLLEIGVL